MARIRLEREAVISTSVEEGLPALSPREVYPLACCPLDVVIRVNSGFYSACGRHMGAGRELLVVAAAYNLRKGLMMITL